MNNLIEGATKAKVILVPKGDDSKPCLRAFEDATGINVPAFGDRKLAVTTNGQTFFKVKGRDIPSLIAAGYGDIGLTGSDSCEDYLTSDNSVAYQSFGRQMCRFVLLAPANRAPSIRGQLKENERYLRVATSFPKLLNQYARRENLKLLPTEIAISGSVEIMPSLLGVPLVADLVSSGATAKANDLVEIRTLLEVYPAIIVKSSINSEQQTSFSYDDIDRVDTVLNRRSRQLNANADNSYTLTLMRDPNKAGKKAGEEFSEVMMAILGDGNISECESEIADLTYAQLVAAYSRNKPVKLSNVIRTLVDRNQNGGSL